MQALADLFGMGQQIRPCVVQQRVEFGVIVGGLVLPGENDHIASLRVMLAPRGAGRDGDEPLADQQGLTGGSGTEQARHRAPRDVGMEHIRPRRRARELPASRQVLDTEVPVPLIGGQYGVASAIADATVSVAVGLMPPSARSH